MEFIDGIIKYTFKPFKVISFSDVDVNKGKLLMEDNKKEDLNFKHSGRRLISSNRDQDLRSNSLN
jgi:hypothetical protein